MHKMKNVDLDFTDKIAENWIVTRIKYFCSMQSGDNIVSEDIEDSGEYPVYGGNGLRGYYSEYTNDGEYVLIGRQGALCGNVHLVEGKFWASDHAIVTYPKNNIYNPYLYYLFTAMDLNKYSETAAQPGLSVKKVLNIKACIPNTIEEQIGIVKVLENKVNKIDNVIQLIYKEIELLELTKKAIITEYVSGENEVNVSCWKYGSEYTPRIPETYECRVLRFLIKEHLKYGANEAGDPDLLNCPRYIRITDITSDSQLKNEGIQYLPREIAQFYMLKDGDVLFARSGATVGKSFFYEEKYGDAAFAGYLIKASMNTELILSKYLWYFTLSNGYDLWKNSVFTQTTIQNIGADKYALLPVTYPKDINRQEEIVKYLDKKCGALDNIIETKKKQIETLEAHKKTLIFDYVTGAKRVKEAI